MQLYSKLSPTNNSSRGKENYSPIVGYTVRLYVIGLHAEAKEII
jgi:hypothetical protein